ncbi:MAG: hypothetical protein K8H88_32350 [Sandaracinaceae bacterium]|nr:hypothetical protein [Sandaracinaceae bacterium]
MGLSTGVWLMLLGVLAAANLIIARKPDAKQYIDKISPYQGWIGAVSCLWGVWIVLWSVLGIGALATWPIWWITMLASGVINAALGLVLGIGVLKSFIKAPAAQQKMDQTLAKIAPYSGTLGLVSIGLGVWAILTNFLFYG